MQPCACSLFVALKVAGVFFSIEAGMVATKVGNHDPRKMRLFAKSCPVVLPGARGEREQRPFFLKHNGLDDGTRTYKDAIEDG